MLVEKWWSVRWTMDPESWVNRWGRHVDMLTWREENLLFFWRFIIGAFDLIIHPVKPDKINTGCEHACYGFIPQ